jgi:hypothetical protein
MDRGQITAHGRVAQAGWEGEMVAANELRRPSEGQAGEEDFFFRELKNCCQALQVARQPLAFGRELLLIQLPLHGQPPASILNDFSHLLYRHFGLRDRYSCIAALC